MDEVAKVWSMVHMQPTMNPVVPSRTVGALRVPPLTWKPHFLKKKSKKLFKRFPRDICEAQKQISYILDIPNWDGIMNDFILNKVMHYTLKQFRNSSKQA